LLTWKKEGLLKVAIRWEDYGKMGNELMKAIKSETLFQKVK
jgi:hypothetical protein